MLVKLIVVQANFLRDMLKNLSCYVVWSNLNALGNDLRGCAWKNDIFNFL